MRKYIPIIVKLVVVRPIIKRKNQNLKYIVIAYLFELVRYSDAETRSYFSLFFILFSTASCKQFFIKTEKVLMLEWFCKNNKKYQLKF